jgi:FtsZ-binding cell division protein ZapB
MLPNRRTPAQPQSPDSSDRSRAGTEQAWALLSAALLLLAFFPVPAAAAPSAPVLGASWGGILLGVGIGAAVVGLLLWRRLRRLRRQAAANTDALQNEKQELKSEKQELQGKAEALQTEKQRLRGVNANLVGKWREGVLPLSIAPDQEWSLSGPS